MADGRRWVKRADGTYGLEPDPGQPCKGPGCDKVVFQSGKQGRYRETCSGACRQRLSEHRKRGRLT